MVKMTLAGWKQQQVVVVELEVVLDLVEMVVEVVDQVEVLVDLVEVLVVVGVVMQHEKKMILNHLKILMIADFPCADFPCAAFSAALIVDLAGAFSWSVLASDLLLQKS